MFSISEDKPLSSLFLVSDKMARYFDTHNAISVVGGHNTGRRCSFFYSCKNCGIWLELLPKKQFRF